MVKALGFAAYLLRNNFNQENGKHGLILKIYYSALLSVD